jgi:hypothetical protein
MFRIWVRVEGEFGIAKWLWMYLDGPWLHSNGCHLHSHGVNEIHTNSECTQVPSVLKLEAMLSLLYPAYTVPLTRVSRHASPKSEVSSKAPLIIHSHRRECRSSSHTQKSHSSIPSKAFKSHVIKMANDGHIRIQETIHTVLRASLLVPI